MVLGLFTYAPSSEKYHKEIDIEFSKWGLSDEPNAQYVVQPYNLKGNKKKFSFDLSGDYSSHGFFWKPDNILFFSQNGHYISPTYDNKTITTWNYRGDIPEPDHARFRINLYLLPGKNPDRESSVEIIIKKFNFDQITE